MAAAARRQGIGVTLATDRCHILEDPWGDRALPVRFEAPEESVESLAGVRADGIVAVADRPTLVAALAAQKLGLPWHSPEAVVKCRDKSRSRAAFEAAGLLTPWHSRASLDSAPPFPCVLKPLGLSASRGVIRANNRSEFVEAFGRIEAILNEPEIRCLNESWNESIQVEEYIPGREFALEGLMTGGELQVLTIFDKPDPLEGPYFEETIYVTPSRESAAACEAMVATTRKAVRALGLSHGPMHAEMRVNGKGVYMLEVAARPIGGLCARALRFTGGLSLEDIIVLHAAGRMPRNLSPAAPASGVMMIPIPRGGIYDDVDGIEEARSEPGIGDIVITAKQGQKLVPLPEGASYLGFLFTSGDDPAFVEAALRRAHRALRFRIHTSLDVLT